MKRRYVLFVVCPLLLAACNRDAEVKKAVAQFDIVSGNKLSTSAEKCNAATKVANEYLKLQNSVQYDLWKTIAAPFCD